MVGVQNSVNQKSEAGAKADLRPPGGVPRLTAHMQFRAQGLPARESLLRFTRKEKRLSSGAESLFVLSIFRIPAWAGNRLKFPARIRLSSRRLRTFRRGRDPSDG